MNKHQLRDLIRETLRETGMYSKDAVELLMMTAAVETNLGEYIKQMNGPGLGIFSIEPATHDDIMVRWINANTEGRKRFKAKLLQAMIGFAASLKPDQLVFNLKYSIVVARLKYYMDVRPIPNNPLDMAKYWKALYNTKYGDGNVVDAFEKYHNMRCRLRGNDD